MKLIQSTALFLLCAFVNGIDIEVREVVKCDSGSDDPIIISINFNKDEKTASGSIDLPIDVDEDDKFILSFYEKNKKGEWELTKEPEGMICDSVKKYIAKAWETIKGVSEPKINEVCSVPKGKYEFDTFALGPEDVNLPPGFMGEYRLQLNLLKDEEPRGCILLEINISE